MTSRLWTVVILGISASLANIMGGWVVFSRREISRPVLTWLLSVAAGFMLAAAFLEVVPRSLDLSENAAMFVLAGYLFVQLVEHTIAEHFHFGEETHTDEILSRGAAYSALSGLALHAFFDGALIAAGFWISMKLGILLFLAVFLHKLPEGFTAASIMRASGRGSRAVRMATIAIGMSTLAGVLSMSLAEGSVRYALPFSAGVTIYVAASDLIPEVNKQRGSTISLGVFAGAALFMISERVLQLAFL